MFPPSGEQYEITAGGYRAVVTEGGATLRALEYDGSPLIDGFAESEVPVNGRGQLLVPWPNRIRDGRYRFEGTTYQLPLSEPARGNASHGLVRWAPWTLEEHNTHSVSLAYRLIARSGYPWTLDLHVVYDLSADGLTVTQTVLNRSGSAAPYAAGAHPYLTLAAPIDGLELVLPAATRVVCDDRMLPVGSEPVDGTGYDFRVLRPIKDVTFDHAFTDLVRDDRGVATVELRDPGTGRGVALWVDDQHDWLQFYSGDDVGGVARRALAVEPMTAPADAFNSGDGLLVLGPDGAEDSEYSSTWGIRASD